MQERKLNYIDSLTVMSAVAVVYLHTNYQFWSLPRLSDSFWISANVIESVCYFAVPVFLMISGATIFGFSKRYGVKEFFRRRLTRALIPYLFWIVPYSFFVMHRPIHGVGDYMLMLLRGPGILWFFPCLMVCYVGIAVLEFVNEKSRPVIYGLVVGIIFVVGPVSHFVEDAFGLSFTNNFSFAFGNDMMIYPILGYFLSRYQLPRKGLLWIYSIGILSMALSAWITWKLTPAGSTQINALMKGYSNWPCAFYSIAVFLFFKNLNYNGLNCNKGVQSVLIAVRDASLSVYLLHNFILCGFSRLLKLVIAVDAEAIKMSLGYRVVMPLVVVVICVLLDSVIVRTYYGRILIGRKG